MQKYVYLPGFEKVERKFLIGIERAGIEGLRVGVAGGGVWNIVRVLPGDGSADRNLQRFGFEGEVVDF